jgi:hypothetical protein
MTNRRAELEALVKRLEEATEPSAELDKLLHWHICHPRYATKPIGWPDKPATAGHPTWGDPIPLEEWIDEGFSSLPYTSSVDAALTLVPDDANTHGHEVEEYGIVAWCGRNFVDDGHWLAEGRHPTSLPIAIVIASLRARIAATPEGE